MYVVPVFKVCLSAVSASVETHSRYPVVHLKRLNLRRVRSSLGGCDTLNHQCNPDFATNVLVHGEYPVNLLFTSEVVEEDLSQVGSLIILNVFSC